MRLKKLCSDLYSDYPNSFFVTSQDDLNCFENLALSVMIHEHICNNNGKITAYDLIEHSYSDSERIFKDMERLIELKYIIPKKEENEIYTRYEVNYQHIHNKAKNDQRFKFDLVEDKEIKKSKKEKMVSVGGGFDLKIKKSDMYKFIAYTTEYKYH